MVYTARSGKRAGRAHSQGVPMSRMKRNHEASGTLGRARRAAAQVKPAAAHAKKLARTAGRLRAARAEITRAWAAPRSTELGSLNRVAPKVSAVVSSAARRLEPAEPKRRPWRKLAVSSVLTTAASAAAAVVSTAGSRRPLPRPMRPTRTRRHPRRRETVTRTSTKRTLTGASSSCSHGRR